MKKAHGRGLSEDILEKYTWTKALAAENVTMSQSATYTEAVGEPTPEQKHSQRAYSS